MITPKNSTIQEGGQARNLTASKLRVKLVGGGTGDWIPEDSVTLPKLGDRTITSNGTYYASSDGLDGYSRVVVTGVGVAHGQDSDGDDARTTTDSSGQLVTQKIPSSIAVTTPPAKTEYEAGETIDYSGMVVKAYLKTGGLWTDEAHPDGIIPISELTLPVKVAGESATGGTTGGGSSVPETTGDPNNLPADLSVNEIEAAIAEALNAGSDICTIRGQTYTIAQAEVMRDAILYGG